MVTASGARMPGPASGWSILPGVWEQWLGFAGGALVVVGTSLSLVRTLVVPRGLTSRIAAVVERVVRGVFLLALRPVRRYGRKDRILVLQGPVTLLAQLGVWLALFLAGYALMLWPVTGASFENLIRQSGSAMLTLGFAAPEAGGGATLIHFAAATTGLVVIALQIAYLPTIYGAFNRRETMVTTLQSRAGVPAWGPEILARHRLVEIVDSLPAFYSEWERWAADLAESHTNYAVLLTFRSPHPLRSWVLALLAVLDSAALYLSAAPASAPSQARLCLRMGFTCLREIAATLRMPFNPDPLPTDPIELTYEEFLRGIHRLEAVGFEMERTPEEAWPHFRGWRVNYEAIAYRLADHLVAAPSLWSGSRRHISEGAIPPLRPVDRRPEDPKAEEKAREALEWRL